MADISQYTIPLDTGICLLDCKQAFENLTDREKLYAHYLSLASWYGGLIVLYQTSPESPGIFLLLQKIFRKNNVQELESLAKSLSLSDDEFKAFLMYAAAFYANMGNYKSFGDSKIVPAIPQEKFAALLKASQAFQLEPVAINSIWEKVSAAMYSLRPVERQLGLSPNGITAYFSANCEESDAKLAQEFLDKEDISAYNTRLFKTGVDSYEVRLASATGNDATEMPLPYVGKHAFSGQGKQVTFNVARGDYAYLMEKVVTNLALAKNYALNQTEERMLDCYIESFTSGSLQAHKEGSRAWIQDKGPAVESYIGFIESYRDPFGVRGEFEGFVAVVNKAMSAKFSQLVAHAEKFLTFLPWPRSYEKDTFLRPDFTSLDVVTFSGSGIPAGINIPNYNEIRQNEGFKNVSLGNVLSSSYKDTKVTFLADDDMGPYSELKTAAFEVQVGLHELLGHGSGKLFMKDATGQLNFDQATVIHLETGGPVTSWYGPGETWDAKFPVIGSSYEECRAESVGLYLCLESDILRIFGYEGEKADDIVYVNWLNMVRAGLLGLEFYTPATKSWRQAHMQARYVILQVLLEASGQSSNNTQKFVSIYETTDEDGAPDLRITLDRSQIQTVGKKAMGEFLQKLQLYKSTADYAGGSAMYGRYSAVEDGNGAFFATRWRDIVLARRQPRKMFVQCNTRLAPQTDSKAETVDLVEYQASAAGVVQSFIDRFPDVELDGHLEALWIKDSAFWPLVS